MNLTCSTTVSQVHFGHIQLSRVTVCEEGLMQAASGPSCTRRPAAASAPAAAPWEWQRLTTCAGTCSARVRRKAL